MVRRPEKWLTTPPKESFRYRYRPRRVASERRGVVSARQLTRTVALGSLALLAILAYLVRELGLDVEQLARYGVVSLAFVLLFAGGGVLAGFVLGRLCHGPGRSRSRSASEAAETPDRDAE
ncbi:MAG: hypothetical protein R3E84_15825 [Pseudomonadales bacterium]